MTAGRRYLLFLAALAGLTGLLLLAGYLPTRAAGGRPALFAMALACAASFAGSALGGLPIALARGAPSQGLALFAASMILRLLVVGVAAGALALLAAPPKEPFLIWLALSYLALLFADTAYAWLALRAAAP